MAGLRDTLDCLIEERDVVEEQLGELEAERRAEIAGFGDAWPGADADIDAVRKRLAGMNERIAEYSASLMGADYV